MLLDETDRFRVGGHGERTIKSTIASLLTILRYISKLTENWW